MNGEAGAAVTLSATPDRTIARPTLRPSLRETWCPVDAGGALAEWVEATVATPGQPTVVHFVVGGRDTLDQVRPGAATRAFTTGARVLVVACGQRTEDGEATQIDRAVRAYAWLVGEGCDVTSTVFSADPSDERLPWKVYDAVRSRGLPRPAGVVSEINSSGRGGARAAVRGPVRR